MGSSDAYARGTLIQGRDANRLRKRYRGRQNRVAAVPVQQSGACHPVTHPGVRAGPTLVIVVAAVLFAACGSADPSASPSTSPSAITAAPSASPAQVASPSQVASPTASAGTPTASGEAATNAIYDAVETQVQALRGLTAVRPVPRQLITADELRTMLTKQFDEETPPAYLAADGTLLQGARPDQPDASLRTLTLDLLSGGVAAFYRDDQGKLYVLSKSGAPGATERFYFSHEYDHALQDQHFSVFKDQKGILDQSDRILARQAVYEGDASLTMTQWAAGNLSRPSSSRSSARAPIPQAGAALSRAPADPARAARVPVHDRAQLRVGGLRRTATGRPSTPSTGACPRRPSRSCIPTSTRPPRRRSR